MTEKNQNPNLINTPQSVGSAEKIYASKDLFEGASSVLIDHRGVIYTLKITQFGKLILTK
jgi:hemin uptake protein HemP